ncbi:MAG: helix-turn-helix transcriptional regulator [Brasilonema octagenarum HA4186-MV1]|jgi:transcriptional regulator with XRE-family HTH domain|nr:helix-turn-helix transcriptional regulator [Brasilonema octagenarum HA4186-MV1]
MDDKQRRRELGDFLKTRRARLSPNNVGLPEGTRRRTPGLRREELAGLANVGLTWYTWLEQGRDIQVSAQVIESIARALQLSPDERTHLFALARCEIPADPYLLEETVSPALQDILDSLGTSPALIRGRRLDVLAWNQAACAVFLDYASMPPDERNSLWIMFTNPAIRQMLGDWEGHAQRLLAKFRAMCDRYAGDYRFTQLVEKLHAVSPEFCQWWQKHDVQGRSAGCKEYEHPAVGQLLLNHTTLQVSHNPELEVVVYTPLPDSDTLRKLQQLRDLHRLEKFLLKS